MATVYLKDHRTARTRPYTWNEVYTGIRADYARLRSLRAVARIYGVNHAVIQRALLGQEPTKPNARYALGLAPMLPAPACIQCGEVHVARTCPKAARKARPRRVAIRTDNMASAAGTIFRNLEPGQVKELIQYLSLGVIEDE